MKTVKKIGLGLSLFIALLSLLSFLQHLKAYAATTYSWQTNNVVSSTGEKFQPVAGTDNFVLLDGANNGVCEALAILKVDAGGKTGTLYPLFPNADARSRAGLDNVDPYLLAQYLSKPGTCKGPASADLKNISISGTPPASVASGGVTTCNPQTNSNCICTSQGCTITSGTTSTNSGESSTNACEANNNTGFEWLICGVLRGLGGFMDLINKYIESQFNFDVNQNLNPNVKTAWNSFRVIASALLVVIMLVMVISQAVSAGPFDAYTIRKLLPRLVAAVIIIQISWVLSIWVIQVANDLGKGMAQILAAPFGGTSQLSLANLLGGLGIAAPTGAIVLTLVATIAAVAINPFGALLLAFFILLSFLVATAALLIRQALIIACVIFMPIAFVAWILPGTQRYWKLLWDNFIKVLLLFPIIIGLIYVGRIFAWIVAGKGGVSGPFDLFAVVIGFFGPYFLLPRTFRWGGNIMSSAASGIEKGVEKMGGEQGRKFLQSRRDLLAAERLHRSQERVADKVGFDRRRPWRFPIDKLRSGQWDPTLGGRNSRIREHKIESYVHAGEETAKKDIEAARAKVVREGQAVRAQGGNWDRYFQMVADGKEYYYDNSIKNDDGSDIVNANGEKGKLIEIGKRGQVERDAARTQTAILGSATNWHYLEQYYKDYLGDDSTKTEAEKVHARKFFDDNVSTIMPKMPHFYQGYGATAEANASTIAGMHAVEVESVLSHYSNQVLKQKRILETETDPEKRADAESKLRGAQRSLVTFMQNFNEAANNPNLQIDNGSLRAVKAFLDKDEGSAFRKAINVPINPENPDDLANLESRIGRNLPEIRVYDDLGLSPENQAIISSIKSSLSPKINPVTGSLDRQLVVEQGQSSQTGRNTGGGSFTPGPGGAYTYNPPAGESTGGFTAEQTIEHDDTQGS